MNIYLLFVNVYIIIISMIIIFFGKIFIIQKNKINNIFFNLNKRIQLEILSYLKCRGIKTNLTCGRIAINYTYPIIKIIKHSTFLYKPLFQIYNSAAKNIICSNYYILIGILTRPECLYERLIIRQVMKFYSCVKCIFISGTSNNIRVNELLKEEIEIYHDMIVFNIISSYYNCSVIMVNFYKYINIYCKNIKWIMKLDIDTYFNIKIILSLINSIDGSVSIIGSINKNPKLICNSNYKWSITCINKNYTKISYPPYPYGPGFLFKFSALKCVNQYINSKKKIIWIEDVLFGVIMKYCGLKFKDITNITEITYKPKYNLSVIENKVFVHGLYPIEILLKTLVDENIIKL